MREIKFRAWDKEEQEMVHDINLLSSSKNPMSRIGDTGNGGHFNPTAEKYEVMQYTGLHDKNGKEIYEGDVVKRMRYPDTYPQGSEDKVESVEAVEYRTKTPFVGYSLDENCEVIGNIYENPELLS